MIKRRMDFIAPLPYSIGVFYTNFRYSTSSSLHTIFWRYLQNHSSQVLKSYLFNKISMILANKPEYYFTLTLFQAKTLTPSE